MSYLQHLKDWLGILPESDGPRIVVIGDSHTAALLRAREFEQRAEIYQHIDIVRVRKEKDGRTIGDMDLQSFLKRISRFGPSDFVFSVIGGNQYAIVSMVQN